MQHIFRHLLIFALLCASVCNANDIFLSQGIHKINIPIIITNSNTRIFGNKSTIFLESKSDCPVIIIGNPTGEPVTNIEVFNLSIDGNRVGQTREAWKRLNGDVINNNGILLQNAMNVKIHDVIIRNCRSGGLVTTHHVSGLQAFRLELFNNEFDGLACYETTNSIFSDLNIHNNLYAGISLDNDFDYNTFSNIIISSNNVGIFMRNSCNNKFNNIKVKNCNLIVFMSQVDSDYTSGCSSNMFDGLMSNGKVIINSETCTNNIFKF